MLKKKINKFNKQGKLAQFQIAILKQPLKFVLVIRLAPISPFNIVNFLFGLTSIHWLSYTLGTFIGIIPGTFAYTWLGVSGIQALSGSDRLFFLSPRIPIFTFNDSLFDASFFKRTIILKLGQLGTTVDGLTPCVTFQQYG